MAVHPLSDDNDNDDADLMHGLPMTEEAFERLVSGENPYRYELIGGLVYNMTGSSPEHGEITDSIHFSFRVQLGIFGPCHVFRDQYVRIPHHPPCVPDLVISCDRADWDKDKRSKPFKVQSPLIIVEVLSPSTIRYDKNEKFARYRSCPTLEVYLLAYQDKRQMEVYRKENDWQKEIFTGEQVIALGLCGLELSLATVYEGIL